MRWKRTYRDGTDVMEPENTKTTQETQMEKNDPQSTEEGAPEEAPPSPEEMLEIALSRKNFVLAADLARSLGRPAEEIRNIQEKALIQMALDFRNPAGTREFAEEYGISRQELEGVLRSALVDDEGNALVRYERSRYNFRNERYFNGAEWIEMIMKEMG